LLRQALASRAHAAHSLCSCLEALRGATLATLSRTQPALWAMTARLLGPLLVLQVGCDPGAAGAGCNTAGAAGGLRSRSTRGRLCYCCYFLLLPGANACMKHGI
jgi:hypothetical protein